MTQLAEHHKTLMFHLTRPDDPRDSSTPAWLQSLRKSAIARFEQTGFPTTRQEEWRFTNVAPIAKTTFVPASAEISAAAASTVSRFSFDRDAVAEMVFVNGHFAPKLSKLGKVPHGVVAMSLGEALPQHPALLERHLARHARIEANPFAALNTGVFQDGALLQFARETVLRGPIHLLFVSTPEHQPTAAHPRVLILADENVEATVVESYVGEGSGVYWTNAVTEMMLADNAMMDHCKVQQESLEAFHTSVTEVHAARSANLISHSATLGGRLTRNDLNVTLDGEGAHATLNGLVILGGEQHCDNHTLLRHEKPNCPSHELYKYVLDGQSTGVFKGKILVQKDAQKTDSKQTNKSLLLSDNATMNAMPALEIYADDVKCTHGSTTGPVDEEMVFYLRSRGVSLEAARHLLSYAFAADITRRIRVEPVRRRLEDFMAAQHGLPQDLRITDLGAHDEAAR